VSQPANECEEISGKKIKKNNVGSHCLEQKRGKERKWWRRERIQEVKMNKGRNEDNGYKNEGKETRNATRTTVQMAF
jgi:hypothetical protein